MFDGLLIGSAKAYEEEIFTCESKWSPSMENTSARREGAIL